eukprot:gene14992-16695_t
MKILSQKTKYIVQKLSQSTNNEESFHSVPPQIDIINQQNDPDLQVPYSNELLYRTLSASLSSRHSFSLPKKISNQNNIKDQQREEIARRKSNHTDPMTETGSVIVPVPVLQTPPLQLKPKIWKKKKRKTSLLKKLFGCFGLDDKPIIEVNLDDFSSVASSDDFEQGSQSSSFYGKSREGSCTSEYEEGSAASAASFYTASDGNRYSLYRSQQSFWSERSANSKGSKGSKNSTPSAVSALSTAERSFSTLNDVTSQFTMSLNKDNEERLRRVAESKKNENDSPVPSRLSLFIPDDTAPLPLVSSVVSDASTDNVTGYESISEFSSLESPKAAMNPAAHKSSSAMSRYKQTFLNQHKLPHDGPHSPRCAYKPPPSYPPVPHLPSGYLSSCSNSSSNSPLERESCMDLSTSSLSRPISQPVLSSASSSSLVPRYFSTSILRESSQSSEIGETYPVRTPFSPTKLRQTMSFSEEDLTSNPTTCTPNTSRSKPSESAYNESFYNLPLIKRSASSFLEARYTPSMQREGPLTSMDSINYSVIYDAKNISMHEYSHEQDEVVVKIVPTKEQQVEGIQLKNKFLGLPKSNSSETTTNKRQPKRYPQFNTSLESVHLLSYEEDHENENDNENYQPQFKVHVPRQRPYFQPRLSSIEIDSNI